MISSLKFSLEVEDFYECYIQTHIDGRRKEHCCVHSFHIFPAKAVKATNSLQNGT
jgi:hypothetical protein